MIAIKGMEMPKCCRECDFWEGRYSGWCDLRASGYKEIFNDKIRQDWCPLIEVNDETNV